MSLHVMCDGCHSWEVVDCSCVPDPVIGHDPACHWADLHKVVTCTPGAGCCEEDHDHHVMCSSCPREHEGDCSIDKPDCNVCRKLVVTAMAGSAILEGHMEADGSD